MSDYSLIEETLKRLAEIEGTEGATPIEGGTDTRGFGVTFIPPELKEEVAELTDEETARRILQWHLKKVKGFFEPTEWAKMPTEMQHLTLDQHYNSGVLFPNYIESLRGMKSCKILGQDKEQLLVVL